MTIFDKRSQLAERALLKIYGGDLTKDRSHEIPDIELAVDSQFAYLMKMGYFAGLQSEKTVSGQWINTFSDVAIKYNESRNECYIERPAIYVPLPREAGIIRIGPMKQLNDDGKPIAPFIYTPAGTSYQTLPCFHLEGAIGYYPEGNLIYFRKDIRDHDPIMVKLLVAGITDINITPDMENLIVDYVAKEYGSQAPNDRTNDALKIS